MAGQPVRRIVMARTQGGTTVLGDTRPPPAIRPPGLPGIELTALWEAGPVPELPVAPDRSPGDVTALPSAGATSFRIVRLDPGGEMAMHATDTIDYLVVLSGEVMLEPEGGSALALRPGDCVVQLGGRHAWQNRSTAQCVLAAVIVGARAATSGV
jgi:quercetin dioxygenase-like cupin family protein